MKSTEVLDQQPEAGTELRVRPRTVEPCLHLSRSLGLFSPTQSLIFFFRNNQTMVEKVIQSGVRTTGVSKR